MEDVDHDFGYKDDDAEDYEEDGEVDEDGVHLLLGGGAGSRLVGSVGHVEVEACALDQPIVRPGGRRRRPLAPRPVAPRCYRLLLGCLRL